MKPDLKVTSAVKNYFADEGLSLLDILTRLTKLGAKVSFDRFDGAMHVFVRAEVRGEKWSAAYRFLDKEMAQREFRQCDMCLAHTAAQLAEAQQAT